MSTVKSRGVRSTGYRARKIGDRRIPAEKVIKAKICANCEQPIASCRCEEPNGVAGWMPK